MKNLRLALISVTIIQAVYLILLNLFIGNTLLFLNYHGTTYFILGSHIILTVLFLINNWTTPYFSTGQKFYKSLLMLCFGVIGIWFCYIDRVKTEKRFLAD